MTTIASGFMLATSLLLAAPSWAQLYESASSLDLTTLTFTGVGVTLTPQNQMQGSTLNDGTGFGGVRQEDALATHAFTPQSWVTATSSVGFDSIGNATAIADSSQFSVHAASYGAGHLDSFVERSGLLRATSAGLLTISVNYTVAHSAISTNLATALAGWGGPQLVLGDQVAHGVSLNPVGSQAALDAHGTLSVTRAFAAGETVSFDLRTETAQSVPIP